MALPPAGRSASPAHVLIRRLPVGHGFRRPITPHVGDTFGNMVTAVAGLTPLEIEPFLLLMGVRDRMRCVVNPGGLTISVPGFDHATSLIELPNDAGVGHSAVSTHEPYRGPSTVARHQVPAVARVVLCRHHVARRSLSLPAVTVKHGLINRRDAVGNKNLDEPIESSEVCGIELP